MSLTESIREKIMGVETRGLPSADCGTQDYHAVLVRGDANDAACYVGTPEWVAYYGAKVSLREAEIYFPTVRADLERAGMTYRGPQ